MCDRATEKERCDYCLKRKISPRNIRFKLCSKCKRKDEIEDAKWHIYIMRDFK